MDEDKKITSGKDKQDVKILIEVSGDKVEVYTTLIPLSENPEFTTEQIKKALYDKGIVFGIKEEVLDLFERDIKYDERLLIASGTKPTEGKDGKIEYSFECNKTVKVKKGEKIGEIILPEEGIEGVTVFKEKIPTQKVHDAKISNLINVEFSPENGNLIISKIDGYLFIDQSIIQVTSFFELEELADEYNAYVKITRPLNEGDFNGEDLKQFLNDNGIVYGILEEEIESFFKQEKFEQPVLIAQGKKEVDGKVGEIKYYFDTEAKPQMDKRGNIDFKELNLIQKIEVGDKLAEVIPPEQGVEGCTVFGKKIPPKIGVQSPLPTGKNTRPDPNNPNVLLSDIEGSIMLKGGNVEVEPVIIIKGNVDYSSGNIDFNGPVIVNGDVKSGFKIKAEGDVQVNGIMEDAVIETGGNALLKMGFIGRGEGKIIAQGNVNAKFCENENIISEGDIYISEYIMHCNIQTKGKLFVTDKTGLIVGGEIYAVKGIEAKVIGNENYTPTKLFVGVDKEFNEKLRTIKAHLAENVEHITNIEKKNTIAEIEKLESKIDEFKKAIVKIIDVVYPGTSITIYNNHITVNDPIKYVYYKYTEEEIVAADLEALE